MIRVSSVPHVARRVALPFVVLPLLALAVAPGAARAVSAHPAAPTIPAVSGTCGCFPPGITLHFHSLIGGLITPYRMGTDAQGNLYVSDVAHDAVYMYNAANSFVRGFGSGTIGTGNGDFNIPEGVAVSGNTVFVVDYNNGLIQTFNKTTGAWISQFGGGTLSFPLGLALASNGQLYVVDGGNNRVVRYNTSGTFLGTFGSHGSGNGQFMGPQGIAASALGYVYVTDGADNRVEQFDLSGTFIRTWGSSYMLNPDGIAVDRANMVYVDDRSNQRIQKFDPNGRIAGQYFAPGGGAGKFSDPGDVAVVSLPNTPIAVYVSDLGQAVVQRFDSAIQPDYHPYEAQWGSGGSGNGQFNLARGIAVDSAGNVYIADTFNNRIQKFDQFGNFLTKWGSGGSANGQFNDPYGIAVDGSGNIFVVDTSNNRVQEFNSSGGFIRAWGSFGTGNGQFSSPWGIAIDGTTVYVADSGNNRVEAFTNTGSFIRQIGAFGTGDGQFDFAASIAFDHNRQQLFVTDYGNNRVEAFATNGVFLYTINGSGGSALSNPTGITTDQQGNLYVDDTSLNRIAQFDVNGNFLGDTGSGGSGNGQFNALYGIAYNQSNGQIYTLEANGERVQRFGSPWPKNDTVGIYRPSTKTFYLRNENSTGPAEIVVPMPYALNGDLPIVGDWNGDGVDTVGLYRSSSGTFLLQDANVQKSAPDYTFTLGINGDTPISGDWSGSGHDGAGVFRPSNGILYLKNALSTGYADFSMVLGVPGDHGVAGDWNGDGQDSPGVYRPSNQTYYLSNKVTNGVVFSDYVATLGVSGDVPFTGDWISQGSSGIGVFRPSNGVTYEKNALTTGPADNFFIYGVAGDVPVAGQWVFPILVAAPPPGHAAPGQLHSGPTGRTPAS